MSKLRLTGFIPEHLREEIEGDLLQRFEKDKQKFSLFKAKRRLLWNTIKFFRPSILFRNKLNINPPVMIGNYFKVMFRHVMRHKTNAFVNVVGLTTGITFALVIGVYVWGELQVNQQLKDVDRLYIFDGTDKQGNWAGWFAPSPMGKVLAEEFPHLVESYYRFYDRTVKLSHDDNHYAYQSIMGDSTLFTMLGLPVIYGDPTTALTEPNSVVITEKVANNLFGRSDVLGETVAIRGFDGKNNTYSITAVTPEPGRNSVTDLININAQVFLSKKNNADFNYPDPDKWDSGGSITYLKLAKGANVEDVEKKVMELKRERVPPALQDEVTLKLLNLDNYYLVTDNGAARKMVITLAAIAIFILLLAVINFVNLSISGATARLKEIGVRKVIGSLKRQIALQFLIESVIITLFSALVALTLYVLSKNFFESVFSASLLSVTEFTAKFWTLFIAATIGVGILPGLYPALLLSSYKAVDSLKGKLRTATSGGLLSRGLVTIQFTISIFVFICAIVINRQITMFLNSDLGYDKSYVMTVSSAPRIYTHDGMNQMSAAKNEFMRLPEVESVSLSWEIPNGNNRGNVSLYPEGGDHQKSIDMRYFLADENYANVYKMEVIDGTFYDNWRYNDIVINEAGAKALGVGVGDRLKPIQFISDTTILTVRGIVKDITQASMREARTPLAFLHPRQQMSYRFLSFRLKPGNIQESVDAVANKWRQVFPDDPFDYRFMDDQVAAMYKTEIQLQKAADIGTAVMTIVVAIGLLGMVSLAVSRRVKEIGIRKVLGASVPGILKLFSFEYITIIAISIVIAMPLAWFEVNNWLQGFAFKIELTWWMFVFPGVALMTLALLVVTATTRKAAISNPVDALRTE